MKTGTNSKVTIANYILFFCAAVSMNAVECIRRTQSPLWWIPMVNVAGLVVLFAALTVIPVRKLLNVPNYIYTGLFLVSTVVIRFHWQNHVGEYLLWQAEIAAFNCWWIGLMLHYLFRQVMIEKTIRIKASVPVILWFVFTVLTVIGKSGKVWPLWFFLMFGGFYLLPFGKEKKNAFWNITADTTILFFLLMCLFCFLYRPYVSLRYTGAFQNSNDVGLYYLMVYTFALFRIHVLTRRTWDTPEEANSKSENEHGSDCKRTKGVTGRNRIARVFYLAVALMALSMLVFTVSKSSYILIFLETVLYAVFVMIRMWKKPFKKVLLYCVIYACLFAAILPIMYAGIRYIPAVLKHRYWFYGEYNAERDANWNPDDPNQYISVTDLLNGIGFRFFKDTYENAEKKADEEREAVAEQNGGTVESDRSVIAEESTVPEASESVVLINTTKPVIPGLPHVINIRASIAKAYLENSTWFGRNDDEQDFFYEDLGERCWHSQNVWVQVTYSFGYLCGAIWLVLSVWLFIKSIVTMLRTKEQTGILPFFLVFLFLMFGITEIVWLPGQMILSLFFLVLHPAMHMDERSQ